MAGSNLTVSEDQKDDSLQDNVPIRNQIQTHKVTKEDMVSYLLNPRGPGHIPAHARAKMKRDHEQKRKPARESATEAALKLLELEEALAEQGVSIDDVDKLSQTGMFPPIHIVKKKNELKAQSALSAKVSTRKNSLWDLLDHAQDIAKHYRSKADEATANKIKSSGTMAKSASGLKRQSQKVSQLAKTNPIVGGHQTTVEPSVSTKSRILDVKKFSSTKTIDTTRTSAMNSSKLNSDRFDPSVKSRNYDDTNFDEDSVMSEMEWRLRKKSMLYTLPEGPTLTVTKIGDQVLIRNSLDKSKYKMESEREGEVEKLNNMSGEAMMAKFKDQLLKRTFQSLNDLADSVGEPVAASTSTLTALIDKEMCNITVNSQDSDVNPVGDRTSAGSELNGRSTQSSSYNKQGKQGAAHPEKLVAIGAGNWRVMDKLESGKGSSLLTLPEAEEARYLAHFRDQEVMKERAKEEVIKALSFVHFSQKGNHANAKEDTDTPTAEVTAALKVSKSLYG
jgi:hypothetical protein